MTLWQSLGLALLFADSPTAFLMGGQTPAGSAARFWGGGDRDRPALNVSHRSWVAALGMSDWSGWSGGSLPHVVVMGTFMQCLS